MADAAAELRTLPHAAFLERMAGAPSASSSEARLGRAAFVALRLVDLLAHDRAALHAGAFHYQHIATERACRDLPMDRTETTHLVGLVRSAADAFQADDNSLVLPALFAYAHYLEDEMRLEHALDVLDTVLHVGVKEVRAPDSIAAYLRIGRVNRKLNRFADAEAAYQTAEELADANNDRQSALLSRAARALSIQGRGDLGEAEDRLREISIDAEQYGSSAVHAYVRHAWGTTLFLRGQVPEAIVHVWRAFELYDDEASRVRALGDLGTMLLAIGEVAGAQAALLEVLRRGHASHDAASNAMIGLMHCASFRRDRVGFERWYRECEARTGKMPPNILADFCLKAAIGHARFGEVRQAQSRIAQALQTAESSGLHEFVFRVKRIQTGLRGCEDEVAEPVQVSEPVQEISASLAQLAGCSL
jgi:tetratricopeptide (TPR) repeat protein